MHPRCCTPSHSSDLEKREISLRIEGISFCCPSPFTSIFETWHCVTFPSLQKCSNALFVVKNWFTLFLRCSFTNTTPLTISVRQINWFEYNISTPLVEIATWYPHLSLGTPPHEIFPFYWYFGTRVRHQQFFPHGIPLCQSLPSKQSLADTNRFYLKMTVHSSVWWLAQLSCFGETGANVLAYETVHR